MAYLLITDIKSSLCDSGQSVITAVIASGDGDDLPALLSKAKELCLGWMILESATATEDLPSIGVKKGDFYFRMKSSSRHGLVAGDEILLNGQG